uniref:Fatty acyl-CoA reductase n=1 Tax=Megaselia scalaris TaxID=36166 RepID=T1GCX2_MEGSC
MLLRNKRNMSIEDRLKDFKDSIMFERLKQEKPNALDKLSVIAGDICEPFLGISEESLKLIENVDILIHSAATVKFDEPIRDSIRKNVGGTFECVKVASKLKRLQLFVHVSTYYSNPYDLEVKNIMYPPPMDWKVALKLADGKSSDELLDSLSGKCTTKFPNTYTFTKNLAENVVNDHQHLFPVLITRPSVILCTRYEPIPGYTEKFQGVTGIIAFLGTGLLHSLYGKPHETLDVIWSDLVVNIHLLSIARIGLLEQKLSKPEIVLICAYPHDPFDLSSRMKYVVQSQENLPFAKCLASTALK